jgi:Zn-dependent metalloprotease
MHRFPAAALLLFSAVAMTAPPVTAESIPPKDQQAVCDGLTYVEAHGAEVGVSDPIRELRARSVAGDAQGEIHVRFDQLHQGVPVFGHQLIVHLDSGGVPQSMTGNFLDGITTPTQAGITGQTAVAIARHSFPGLVAWTAELFLLPRGDDLVLVYRVILKGEEPPARIVAFVDAATGALVDSYNDLKTATGHSLYSGEVSLATDFLNRDCDPQGLLLPASCPFALRDRSRGLLRTLDAQDKGTGKGVIFTDADNTWGDGTIADRASAAVDAHFGAEVAFDYFFTVHRRNGIRDDGKGPVVRAHYVLSGDPNVGCWDCTCKCMEFGDGDGVKSGPWVSLDVVGHEMTHGITEATADLHYWHQSGGLNESMSDIFGTEVEFFAASRGVATQPDFLIAEDSYTPAVPDDALRYMDDPTRDVKNPRELDACKRKQSIDSFLDYKDCLDVHYTSGIANNVYYLLAQGGMHRNGGRVIGIGRSAAARIFYEALVTHMTSSETFKDALAHTVAAAEELFGTDSPEAAAVCQAWNAAAVDGFPCSTCPKGGVVPPRSFEERFRATNNYAGTRGYSGGFPTFRHSLYDACEAHGTVLLLPHAAEGRNVRAADLGNPAGVEARFRAVNDYAGARGFAGGYPNFHQAGTGSGLVYGVILLRSGTAEGRDVPAAELGHPADAEALFRAVNDYAIVRGFVGGFPNFHQADTDARTVYGTILIKLGAAEWRDVAASGLP